MFNTERNRNIANRMSEYLYRNINHEDMVADEKYFGTLPAKGDNLEINEDISPAVYNKAVNGESLFGTLPDLAPDDVPSKRVIGSGMEPEVEEDKKVVKSARKGKAVAVFKGQSEDLFGKGASGGRKPSSWLVFVKEYAKTNGVSYKQAMKDAKSSYASQKGSKDAKQPRMEVKRPLPVKSQMKPSDLMGGGANTGLTEEQKQKFMKLKGFKKVYDLYHKNLQGSGRDLTGSGFFDDVGNWFNQAGKDINQFLKDNKVLSTVSGIGSALVSVIPGVNALVSPALAAASAASKALGYGYSAPKGKQTGGAKKPSAWITHVKDYAKKHGVSYKEALTKAKASYKK